MISRAHQRNSLPGHLNCVSVPELMRCEPTPDLCRSRGAMELRSDPGRAAAAPARGSVQDAEERTDRQALAQLNPWLQLLPGPAVHTNLAALAALSVPNEDRASNKVKVGLSERERFADPKAGAPQNDDHRMKPDAAGIIRCTHDRDDLLDRRRVRRVFQSLVVGRAPLVS
jgi:hypothetical protein